MKISLKEASTKLQEQADEITFSGVVEEIPLAPEKKFQHRIPDPPEQLVSGWSMVKDYSVLWIIAVVLQILGIGIAVGIGITK